MAFLSKKFPLAVRALDEIPADHVPSSSPALALSVEFSGAITIKDIFEALFAV